MVFLHGVEARKATRVDERSLNEPSGIKQLLAANFTDRASWFRE
jgi:hypothetical protein